MLKRRLQGVLRQYGPVVAFMTTDVLLGNHNHVYLRGPTSATMKAVLHDTVLLEFLQNWIGARAWTDVYDPFHPREDARMRARLGEVFERFLERGDWYAWLDVMTIGGHGRRDILVNDVWPPIGGGIPGATNLGFGFNTRAAIFAGSNADVIVPWVASIVNRYVKYGVPIVTGGDIDYLVRNIGSITDWANATHPDLMRFSVPQAVDAQREWHEEMKHAATGQAVGKGEVVHRFPDRWTFERLTTAEQLSDEGASQGHCVGGTSYRNAVESGAMRIYSLRDPKGVPHVTVEIEQATSVPASPRVPAGGPTYWRLRQVKGRGNHRVSKPDLCKKLDTAFSLLGLGLTVKGSQWGGTADWDGCEPIVRPELYTDLDEDEPRRAENPVRSSWDDSMHAHRAYGRR